MDTIAKLLYRDRINKISDFNEIDIYNIEFVSFFSENGDVCHEIKDPISHNLLQYVKDSPFLYAFVNMIGGNFFIVENEKK